MGSPLIPDLAEAQRFADLLEPEGDFWFQTVSGPKRKVRGVPRVFHGKLVQHWQQLVEFNLDGFDIHMQINAGSGRKNPDVDRIRAYFVDLDGAPAEPLFSSAQPADIIVETSPEKFHGYWLTGNAPLEEYAARMQSLATRFGGDHSVCHLARVMRLPGTIHSKAEPFISRIVKVGEGL